MNKNDNALIVEQLTEEEFFALPDETKVRVAKHPWVMLLEEASLAGNWCISWRKPNAAAIESEQLTCATNGTEYHGPRAYLYVKETNSGLAVRNKQNLYRILKSGNYEVRE